MNRKLRSCLSLLMTICLLAGISGNGFAALAEGTKTNDDKLVYVSIGDSMTNGYGMDGYDGSSGIVNYAMDTFSNRFAAWLAGYTGQIVDDQVIFEGSNGVVDHRQLAMSGMRPEDVHWLLELDHADEALIQKVVDSYINCNWEQTMPRWYGEFGFKTGDYRTWTDLVSPTYRLADGAAKILATYNGDMETYFRSSYATEALVKAAVTGLAKNSYYPANKTDRAEMGEYKFLQIAAEFYQESVKDADIVSLSLGNTNFGTFMFNEIIDVIYGNTEKFGSRYDIEQVFVQANLNPVLEAALRVLIEEMSATLEEQLGALVKTQEARTSLKNIVIYCAVSYLVHYVGALEAILALNPDVQIIQTAMMNTYKIENPPAGAMTVGDLAELIYAPIDIFLAGLPALMQATGNSLYQDATFYYAENDIISCMVEVYGDDFYKVDGQYIKYPGLDLSIEGIQPNGDSIVRERFMEYSTGRIFGILAPLADKFGIEGGLDTSLTVATINKYEMMSPAEKAKFIATNARTAISCALYLAFENAIINAGRSVATMDSVAMLGNLGAGMFGGVMEEFNKNIGTAGVVYADVASDTVLAIAMDMAASQVEAGIEAQLPVDVTVNAKDLTADPDQALASAKNIIKSVLCAQFGIPAENFDVALATNPMLAGAYNTLCEQYASALAGALMQGYQGAIEGAAAQQSSVQQLCMVLAMPQTLSDALISDETVAGVLCLAARGDLGTGIGTHPSPKGHDTILKTILYAYSQGYTPADKTSENIQAMLDMINESLGLEKPIESARDDFRIHPDSYYLALGDKSAYGPAADQAVQKWGISYSNATVANQTAAQLAAALPEISAEIAKADLITIGFNANSFTNFAFSQVSLVMIGKEPAPLDLTVYLGTEGAAKVNGMLAGLKQDLAFSGQVAGMDMGQILSTMIDSLVYAYVEYAVSCIQIEKTIHAINPKTQVALLGMHNALKGISLNLEGAEIPLGDYVGALISAANLSSLGYAFTAKLTDYVGAPEVQTVEKPNSQNALMFLMNLIKNGTTSFVPTEEGYAYLAERLVHCITYSERIALQGDVDGNDTVNHIDAMLVLQYYTEVIGADDLDLGVADVDGNGVINHVDSMLILQYYTEVIEVFPALE